MKNMMLQVKKFSKIALCALLIMAAGCKGKNEPESIHGDKTAPSWSAPEDYDYSSSMTAVVKVDLQSQYPESAADFTINEKDLLAAFADEQCLGVASPQDGLFFLYIAGTEGSVTLRYYSAQYKNLFAAEPIPYQNDTHLGTVAEPYSPAFSVIK